MKKVKVVGTVVLLAVVGLIVYVGLAPKGVKVTVENTSGNNLEDLQVVFTGGVEHLGQLEANKAVSSRINPESESSLKITWRDSAGNRHSEDIDIYMERNYKGHVTIRLESNNSISVDDDIKPY